MEPMEPTPEPRESTWQERVEQEYEELSVRVRKLDAFLESPAVEALSFGEHQRLNMQLCAMMLYADILRQRIGEFH